MSEHTPGPWTVWPSTSPWRRASIGVGDTGASLALVFRSNYEAECEANAHLIAAAPDLLAACLYAERNLGRVGARDPGTGEPCWEVVHGAILKAMGKNTNGWTMLTEHHS